MNIKFVTQCYRYQNGFLTNEREAISRYQVIPLAPDSSKQDEA